MRSAPFPRGAAVRTGPPGQWHDRSVSRFSAAARRHIPSRAGLGTPLVAMVSLLFVAAIWGSSYPLTKVLLTEMSARQFLALRFAIAAAVLLAVFFRRVLAMPRDALLRSIALGALFGIAQLMQTVGLAYTPATVSGFITGLYVVFTPLCAFLLLRTAITARIWIGSALAIVGLGILALEGFSLGFGEWITLASALLFALHILALGVWATPRHALGMAVVQMVMPALICGAATIPEGFATPGSAAGWVNLVYLAVFSGGAAMILQTWAQSRIPASRAAIVMATEPAWAALFAISFFAEPLTWRVLVGGTMMLTAMVVVEAKRRLHSDPLGPADLPRLAG